MNNNFQPTMQVTPQQLQMLQKMQQQQQPQQQMPQMPPTAVNILGADGRPTPLMVQARDCVDQSALHQNIAENIKLMDKMFEPCAPHRGRVLIVSAGPSTEKNLALVKAEQEKGTTIVCIKHSLPMLMAAGIVPDACVILDPRDLNGTSTHNIVRKDLFKNLDTEKTIFYVASMTNTSVTKYLIERGAKVVRWDATVADIHTFFKYQVQLSIPGGSCSAIRAVGLFKLFGFFDFAILGFDCCFDSTPKDVTAMLPDGRPKYFKTIIHGQEFLTTGELVALTQDIERLINNPHPDIMLEILGGGIPKVLYDNRKKQKTYEEMLKGF